MTRAFALCAAVLALLPGIASAIVPTTDCTDDDGDAYMFSVLHPGGVVTTRMFNQTGGGTQLRLIACAAGQDLRVSIPPGSTAMQAASDILSEMARSPETYDFQDVIDRLAPLDVTTGVQSLATPPCVCAVMGAGD